MFHRSFRPDRVLVAVVALALVAGNMWCGTAFGQTVSSDAAGAMSVASSVQAVIGTLPMPSTYALMGGAFAVIGLMASRRHAADA